MPLPVKGLKDWPFELLYADREDYERRVWNVRKQMWQQLLGEYKPAVIYCYGEGTDEKHWRRFSEVFGDPDWKTIAAGKAKTARLGASPGPLTGRFCSVN